jgi:hypothetical protein
MILKNGTMERGVGFCLDPQCMDFQKDIFLLEHFGPFKCSRCHKPGVKVLESGETDNDYSLDFWQVRVEFCYDIATRTYRSIAIVSDETMPKEGNVYTLRCPIVKTEKRALMMAESILGSLMRADDSIFAKGYIHRDQTYNIDFDKPIVEVKNQLKMFEDSLLNSRLRKSDNG